MGKTGHVADGNFPFTTVGAVAVCQLHREAGDTTLNGKEAVDVETPFCVPQTGSIIGIATFLNREKKQHRDGVPLMEISRTQTLFNVSEVAGPTNRSRVRALKK